MRSSHISEHLRSRPAAVVVLAAGQITTFHTMSAMPSEVILGPNVTVEADQNGSQMIAADEHRMPGPARVYGASQDRRMRRRLLE